MEPDPDIIYPGQPARHDAIARRAHALWERKGRRDGEADADWLAAEAELRAADREDDEVPRDVEDPAPITLDDTGAPPEDRARGGDGRLPPPHR